MAALTSTGPLVPAYPATRRDASVVDTYHSTLAPVADPFRALEDPDSDETRAFVAAQQAVTGAYLAQPSFAPLRATLRARLEALYNYGRSSAPYVRGGRGFVYRNTGLQNQDVLYQLPHAAAPSADADDVFAGGEPFLDLNSLFPDGTTSLSTSAFSEDGSLWAYALSRGGSDWVTIYVKDVATGKDRPEDVVPHVKFSGIAWLHDNSGFFYSRYPAARENADAAVDSGKAGTETSANEHAFVCFHKLGTDAKEDLLVYACPAQPNWRGGVGLTDDGEWLYLSTSKGTDPVNRLYYVHLPTHWAAWLAAHAKPAAIAPGGVPPVQGPLAGSAGKDGHYTYLPFVRWADNFDAEWEIVANDGDRFYFRTNLLAPRYRIVAADLPRGAPLDEAVCLGLSAPAAGAAVDIDLPRGPTPTTFDVVPQHASDVLDWASCVAGRALVLCYMRNCVNALQVRLLPPAASPPALTSTEAALLPRFSEVPLPAPGTVASFAGDRKQDTVFLKFTSFLHPGSILRLRFSAEAAAGSAVDVRAVELREPSAAFLAASSAAVDVASPEGAERALAVISPYWDTKLEGFRAADYEARQVFVPSKPNAEGRTVEIPMFIVGKKGLVVAGAPPPPALVYGYGGFNISLPPSFSPLRLAWLGECGGLYALANIRGGGEKGEEWHKGGMRLTKQNCFDDLARCAEYLVENGQAAKRRVAVLGGSNGGLLALVCALQRPDLFGASVAQVPVADMMRFHKFTIGSAWRGEYGFAEDNLEDCRAMLAYSPLHNVRAPTSSAEELPSVLITTADHDDRVVPLHSFKMAATLQAVAGTSPFQRRPLLVRIDSKAGHGAGKSTTKVLDEYADVYAFLAHELGRA